MNREEERNARFEAIQKANERDRKVEAEKELDREKKKRIEHQDKLNKPSLQGFLLTIAYYGGIALVILFILGMLYEFGSASPSEVDRLPPSWEP